MLINNRKLILLFFFFIGLLLIDNKLFRAVMAYLLIVFNKILVKVKLGSQHIVVK